MSSLKHMYTCPRVPIRHILIAGQPVFVLTNVVCLVEKQQIPFILSLVWPDQCSIYRARGEYTNRYTNDAIRNLNYYMNCVAEQFVDTKGVIRIRKSKDRQYNGKMKMDKRINNYLQQTTQKTKDWARKTHWKPGVRSSCFTSGTRRVCLLLQDRNIMWYGGHQYT